MAQVLHILTHDPDPLTQQLLAPLPEPPGDVTEVFRLNQASPDYRLLLEKIFQADSIAVD